MSQDHDMHPITCTNCSILFTVEMRVITFWERTKKNFFCPNGHSLQWVSNEETTKEKLAKELAAALKQAKDEKARADALAVELELWRPRTNAETPP
jgi:hypothetical protein